MKFLIAPLWSLRLIFLVGAVLQATPVRADAVQAMRTALELASGTDWDGALAVAPSGVGRDVIEWQRLRAGEGRLGDYEAFLARRADWPGLPLIREKGEEAVARSEDPARVIAWFAAGQPQTGEGAVAYVRALMAAGRMAEAETEAMRAWAELSFTAEEEAALIALKPEAVGFVHEMRLNRLLWDGKRSEAERMLPRVAKDMQALARARLALQAESPGVTALIEAVPESRKNDAGLAYDRLVWRMKRELYDEALELILDRSTSAEALGRPEAWAERRAILARYFMRKGRAADAYRAAANHFLTEGTAYADLEFLAGFIALRRLNDPPTALTHFQNLLAGVSTPISLARAHYWLGRTKEAAGQGSTESYQAAAAHQTTFYGLLAAERLGLPLDAALLSTPSTPDWKGAAFVKSSALEASRLLLQAGDLTLSKRFLLHLARAQDDTGLTQMAAMVLDWKEPHLAVLIGKAAAERGIILSPAYYPVPDFVPDGLKVSRALALAIARRESEFDPGARSPADARGLMQVLPGTAKLMAGKLGVPHEVGKLLTDPAYNVTMGAAYLAEMADEFGSSIALIASGYNAGPGRPRRWIGEFGDPRRPDVDVVDWVETIPFSETRTYVMRVAEGVVIYRAKLKGAVGPVRITEELKG
ncbi:MAG: lytic transglycosylase [Rhodobacter sp.]|nr:lytic transglycosylase [Rhodobacter sp.]